MKVLVAMSGGIDSSVSAILLRRAGHDVAGVFMRHGVRAERPARPGKQGCCSLDDAYDARRVADDLGIPFYVLNFEEEFDAIIRYFVSEYHRGATPNPCIRCNRDLKFGRLLEYADAIGAHKVATGHYARVEERDGRHLLRRGADVNKDQSYVLFPLTQERLARCVFPVGHLTKPQVREIAREAGLRIAEKPESMEICFVPDNDHRRLLRQRLGEEVRAGEFRTTRGRVVGRHPGYQLFTIGQRKGLGVALGRPVYVVAIDPSTNTVVLGDEEELKRESHDVREVNWIAVNAQPGERFEAAVKIRARHEGAPATVEALREGRARVTFHEPQRAVTPGQAAVFYRDDGVLGGGWIE
ncbi:MAG: tRNA 2-thiouridine(34) synthase MnmA [Planctomycetes bacterium]|nr:tRNA 2-thiouridine(34) synthase MnmA [Planctomycetota bacterium]